MQLYFINHQLCLETEVKYEHGAGKHTAIAIIASFGGNLTVGSKLHPP